MPKGENKPDTTIKTGLFVDRHGAHVCNQCGFVVYQAPDGEWVHDHEAIPRME